MGTKTRVKSRTKARKVIKQPTLLCFMAKRSEGDSSLGGARQRASTATSAFGVSKRESHDSSTYYNSRMNANLASSRDVGRLKICQSNSRMSSCNKMLVLYPSQTIAFNWSSHHPRTMLRRCTMMISPCKNIFNCSRRCFRNAIVFSLPVDEWS